MKETSAKTLSHGSAPEPHITLQDEAIINTNSYSIVSKRSVEKLYYPNENFFSAFVPKFERRAPLINRGYWLRMRAVEAAVVHFLRDDNNYDSRSEKGRLKVVVNLGCGYDPLPLQMLRRHPELARDTKFVDVDYPKLMRRKKEVFLEENLLGNLAEIHELKNHDSLLLDSRTYAMIGCDLRELSQLKAALNQLADVEACEMLFVAEVSITYMPVDDSDAVIRWAASFPNARFCLLEQLLPDGPAFHPFARTMLQHFAKHGTPIKAVEKYQTTEHQRSRFLKLGWTTSHIRNLWALWADNAFLTAQERQKLDEVEPFDEWEEFALFGCHYFILYACTGGSLSSPFVDGGLETLNRTICPESDPRFVSFERVYHQNSTSSDVDIPMAGIRRLGAAFVLDNQTVAHQGGISAQGTRDSTCDYYTNGAGRGYSRGDKSVLEKVVSHTITRMDNGTHLKVGGRTSPSNASPACYFQPSASDRGQGWVSCEDILPARYRHCAVDISMKTPGQEDTNYGTLCFGGKASTGEILGDWQLWYEGTGWLPLSLKGSERPASAFGATLLVSHITDEEHTATGFLFGGISSDGTIVKDCWRWTVQTTREESSISFDEVSSKFAALDQSGCYARFGAKAVKLGTATLLIGGVCADRLLEKSEEILLIHHDLSAITRFKDEFAESTRPILVGFDAVSLKELNQVLLVGGGAVCFSFGSFHNRGCWTLRPNSDITSWEYIGTSVTSATSSRPHKQCSAKKQPRGRGKRTKTIQKVRITEESQFKDLLAEGKPAILQGHGIGSCTTLWTSEYLKGKIGQDRKVVVHSSPDDQHMSFDNKNFSYVTMSFEEFLERVDRNERLYLRSVSSTKPSKAAANFRDDFPEISSDFAIPGQLALVSDKEHSSVFRIAGDITLWLHYDVMANILCLVKGRKRLLLFPPKDVTKLGFKAGSTTSDAKLFTSDADMLSRTHPHEAMMEPGDILFLPPCWPHAAEASTCGEPSIAVNVFFRSFDRGYSNGRDVYGNRDLMAYENGRKWIATIAGKLWGLYSEHDRREAAESILTCLSDTKAMDSFVTSNKSGYVKDVTKLNKAIRELPTNDLRRFYLDRLKVELIDLVGS